MAPLHFSIPPICQVLHLRALHTHTQFLLLACFYCPFFLNQFWLIHLFGPWATVSYFLVKLSRSPLGSLGPHYSCLAFNIFSSHSSHYNCNHFCNYFFNICLPCWTVVLTYSQLHSSSCYSACRSYKHSCWITKGGMTVRSGKQMEAVGPWRWQRPWHWTHKCGQC